MAGAEQARLWRVPEAPGTDLLHAHYVDHRFNRHSHAEYAIGVIESGLETFTYRGGVEYAPAGAVVVIEPEQVHTGGAGGAAGWTYRMLYPPSELVAAATGNAGCPPRFRDAVLHDPGLARLLGGAHRLLGRPGGSLDRQAALSTALRVLVGRHSRGGLRETRLRFPVGGLERVRQVLHDDPAANPRLEELGALAGGLSPYQLSRGFVAHTGLPPHAYLVQLRCRRARTLLAAGDRPAQVAALCGFTDQSHLHRHFVRMFGVTPGAYARATAG